MLRWFFNVALLVAVCFQYSETSAQTRLLHAAPGTPVIDGEMEGAWRIAPVAKVDRMVEEGIQIDVSAAPTALFRCLWDEDNLYVFAEVKDANVQRSSAAAWEQDSVEIFIDENFARTEDYETGNDGQFRVNAWGEITYGQTTGAQMKAVAKKTGNGYQIEAAIPFQSIKPQDGKKIGFELQINNDEGKGARASITKWNDPTNNSWHDTSAFGTVVISRRQNVRPYEAADANNGHVHKPHQIAAKDRVPAWAKDAVFYQIFPERFRNGDTSNDPTHASLEFPDIVPKSWEVRPWGSDWYKRSQWEREIGDNFYEDGVFHRRYGGDLQGVVDKLDYLSELGINTIYFNPVFYARSLHKYDGNSFHHIDPHFGPDPAGDFALMEKETSDPATWNWTKADLLFLSLVKKAHQKNIRVIIDGVFNHTGRDFWAFADIAKKQKDSEYLDWYTVEKFDDPNTPENEFKYACWWGVDTLPEFADNEDGTDLHPKPKAYVFQATSRWMDPNGDGDPSDGIDGWRLDVANEVPNQFWRDWNHHVRKLNKDAFTVAEIWNEAGDYLANCGFSSTMNYYGFAFPVKGFLINADMKASEFGEALVERKAVHDPAVQYAVQNLIDGHDTDRLTSMIVNAVDHDWPYMRKDRFDYDVGERVSPRHYPSYDVAPPGKRHKDLQRLVALFQMSYVGPPMIYYGTEASMDGADDPCDRMPMVWPDLEYDSRKMGPYGSLGRKYPVKFDQEMFDFYKSLISVRHKLEALRQGDFSVCQTDDNAKLILFQRSTDSQTVMVALNRGEKPAVVEISKDAECVVHTKDEPKILGDNKIQIPPESGAIWVIK